MRLFTIDTLPTEPAQPTHWSMRDQMLPCNLDNAMEAKETLWRVVK